MIFNNARSLNSNLKYKSIKNYHEMQLHSTKPTTKHIFFKCIVDKY